MPRGIDNVDFRTFIVDRNVFGENGDTPFTLQIVVVEHQFARLLVGAKEVSCEEHLVHEGRLSVIDVGNNGNVANILHIEF